MRAYWRRLPLALLATAVGLSAAQAGWQQEASPYDVKRLSLLDEAKQHGIAEAQSSPDAAMIRAVVDAQPQEISAHALAGTWRCRTIKLGGMTPDKVYSWFTCRVGERHGGLFFEKLSGGQRLEGTLYPHEAGGYVLLAATSVKGETGHAYSGNGASAGAQATPDDAIGLLQATGRSSARIEFPYPVQESVFDVIEMKR